MAADINNFEWRIGEEGWSERPSSVIVATQFNHALASATEQRIILGVLRTILLCVIALAIGGSASLSWQEVAYRQRQAAIVQAIDNRRAGMACQRSRAFEGNPRSAGGGAMGIPMA